MSFVIFGCGGIGNNILFALSSMGFKNFLLIDPDIVEETNLNRQLLFTMDDIGSKKINALEKRIKERFLNLSIKKLESGNLEQTAIKELFKEYENGFVILSADQNICIEQATKISNTMKYPLLNVGYLNDFSCVGPIVIPTNKDSCCLMCNANLITKDSDDDD